jgi:3-methyladenine DNA glycosylase AlkD
MDMNAFVLNIEAQFEKHADKVKAAGQKAYMRNRFEFFGIKSPIRKEIQRPFLKKENLPPKAALESVVKTLWNKPQREFQYFTMELVNKYSKQFSINDIVLFEWMITHKSWWDTVDYIAPHLAGDYFKIFPGQRDERTESWIQSENIWLKRSAILFQLKYKSAVDTAFLSHVINSLSGTDEFFINKAIGWMLRQYSKFDPQWVIDFVDKTALHPLSRREALKVIERK